MSDDFWTGARLIANLVDAIIDFVIKVAALFVAYHFIVKFW